ncbi:MAG: CdaR family protein [Gemmatimonadota bacterium]|nr:CdaR family protein [Gemmatimonadota bacterium]
MPSASRVFHNWRLKLSALGLALFLWAVVQAEPSNRETFSTVPVQVELSDTSWVLAGPVDPPVVEIRLGGVAREIIRLAREGTTVRIPVASVGSRDTVVAVQRNWVAAAQRPGVTVESVTPSTVSLSFEPAVTRLVPVAPRIRGRLPDDLALVGDISPNPQFVRVRGPESRMAGLDSVGLETFDLGTVSQSGVFTVAVDTTGLAGGTAVPSTVSLGVRVERVVERMLPGIVVRVEAGDGDSPLVAEPRTIRVRIAGARSLVTGLDIGQIEASVDPEALRRMAPGEVRRVPVEITGVPERVRADALVDGVEVRRATDVGLSPPGTGSW